MSENNNNNNNINNIRNDINPENIETIDFDALESISTSISSPKAEVDSSSIEEIKEDLAEVGENKEIDSIDSIDSDDSDDSIDPVSPRLNLVDLNLIGELQEGEVKYLQIGEACIEVKSKLRYSEVFSLIEIIANLVTANQNFVSSPLKEIVKTIYFLRDYTNLNMTYLTEETFLSDELYDAYGLIIQTGIYDKVRALIDQKQLDFFDIQLENVIADIITYKNSAAGQIETITQNSKYTADSYDQILDSLKDVENQEAIQKVLEIIDIENGKGSGNQK